MPDSDTRLPEPSQAVLAWHADAIRDLVKRTREDIVEIGRHLAEARIRLIDNGVWLAWLKAEFDWSDQTAYRFIHVYKLSRDLPLGVLYRFAAPKAEAARTEIAERVESGEQVTAETVIAAVTGRRKSPANETADTAAIAVDPDDLDDAAASAAARKAAYERAERDDATDSDRERAVVDDDDGAAHFAATTRSAAKKPGPSADEVIAGVVLDEFFAAAAGADILNRIPAERHKVVVAGLLDALGVADVLANMSDAFGAELRARVPAPKKSRPSTSGKSRKPFGRTINLTAEGAPR
jgi:hypothetical protein